MSNQGLWQHASPSVDHEELSCTEISHAICLCQHESSSLACVQNLANYFLRRPYLAAPCGEGLTGELDQMSLYRTDGFDCVTWVNTVLALLQSNDVNSFERELIAMNYQNNQVEYTSRCHIMSTQWNRWNESRGALQNITSALANRLGGDVETADVLINYPAWLRARSLRDIRLRSPMNMHEARDRLHAVYDQANKFNPERTSLSYLPLSLLKAYADSGKPWQAVLPELCVVQWVRKHWHIAPLIGTDLHVMHVGFLMHDEDDAVFCHASWGRGIVKDPIKTMLNTCERLGVAGVYVQGLNI